MAQVPTAVATTEPNNTRPLEAIGGKTEFGRSKIREERNREGKTFAEVMDKAGKDLPSSETATGKKIIKSRRKDRSSTLNGFKHSSGPGKSAGKIGLLKTRKIRNIPALVKEAAESETQLLHSDVKQLQIQNHPTQLAQAAAQTAVNAAGDGEIRPGNTENTKNTGKSSSIDARKNDTGLSGSAPRIEIVDNRNKITAIDPQGNSSKQESSGKADSRDLIGRKSIRLETAGKQNTDAAAVKSDAGFAVAETDIELNSKSEIKMTERSAAAELARKLDAQAGNDIVRQVKVVLNRANTGEVRINLRPDNLGRVSVRINLDDNRLTGRIFVETAAAREAFRNALDGLQTKLVESGFGAADLELAWDDSGKGFPGSEQHSGNQKNNRDEALREFENIVPTTVYGESVDSRVNMVV